MEQPGILFIVFAFVVVLGPLIFFHELGHYAVARLFGVKSETFSIGFGREIFGWTDKQGTRWKVAMLPLGGYVRFAGDADAASSPDRNADPDPSHFQNKPVGQRFLIVLAGPLANFLLAILIFWGFFVAFGQLQGTGRIAEVQPDSAAAEAGLQAGDEIRSIDGREIGDFQDLQQVVMVRPEQQVTIAYVRDGREAEAQTRIREVVMEDRYGQEHRVGQLGVLGEEFSRRPVGPLAALGAAVDQTGRVIVMIVDGIGQILFGSLSVKELGGPVKMAQISGQQAQMGVLSLVSLAAFLSINLGFINLLPVPMLDGGHLLFYTIEAIRKRPVGEMAQEWAFRGGLALLLALMLFLTANDLMSVGLFERLGRLIG